MAHSNQRISGFTLIEMVISLGIFMLFIGMVLSIFISLTATQQKTNYNRETVSETKNIINTISTEAKEKAIDYNCYEREAICGNRDNNLALISPNGLTRTIFSKSCTNGFCNLTQTNQSRSNRNESWALGQTSQLNSDKLKIKDLKFLIYPKENPFNIENAANDKTQFQPVVNIIINIARTTSGNSDPIIIQTSVTSRIYNEQ